MADVVAQMGPCFLGSRLKRLGERMQAGAAAVIADTGLPIQPGHCAVLAALRTGPRTIGQLAEASGTSQPGVTRTVAQLAKLGLIADEDCADQRSRMVKLTTQGEATVTTIAAEVWPRVGMAAQELLSQLDGDFLAQLTLIEQALSEASIADRAARVQPGGLSLREFDDSLAGAFHDIGMEWIESMFKVEETDREVLENPRRAIVDQGGAILFVEAAGHGIIGTGALQKTGPASFELTKMGVRENARGLKAGDFLLKGLIDKARDLGAKRLYLLTNRKCQSAIHLYEKNGFIHSDGVLQDCASRYDRCDVAMLYTGG